MERSAIQASMVKRFGKSAASYLPGDDVKFFDGVKMMKLSETKNLMRVVAEASIKEHGYYTAKIDGQKVLITA